MFLLDPKKHPESLTITKLLIQEYNKSPEKLLDIIEEYVAKYPLSKNVILENVYTFHKELDIDDMINKHEKCCLNKKIYTTPTLFIDGKRLSGFYTIKDIDYLY